MERFFRGGFGSKGGGDGQFFNPMGIAVGTNGDIYVVDHLHHRIQRFSSFGSFLGKWGSIGTANDQFRGPMGIAVDSNFDVYVTDSLNHRVQKFDRNGVFIRTWGSRGTGNGQFIIPHGIAVESDDDILVVDRQNHRIQKFTSDGEFIRTWGSRGTSNNQFEFPNGIAIDSDDNNYVTEGGPKPPLDSSWAVKKFDRKGNFIKKWGGVGRDPGKFAIFPRGISISGNTLIVVTPVNIDSRDFSVHEFSIDGVFITRFGSTGTEQEQFIVANFVASNQTSEGLMHYITCTKCQSKPIVKIFSPNPGPIIDVQS
jgi:tripartite motif-containing protein 71